TCTRLPRRSGAREYASPDERRCKNDPRWRRIGGFGTLSPSRRHLTATAEDVIAAKIVCQLRLAEPDRVKQAIRSLDRAPTDKGVDLLSDLFSRGPTAKASRIR